MLVYLTIEDSSTGVTSSPNGKPLQMNKGKAPCSFNLITQTFQVTRNWRVFPVFLDFILTSVMLIFHFDHLNLQFV